MREEARKVALKAKFKQTKLSDVPVKVSCMLAYTFLPEKTEQTEETPQPYFEPPIISLGVINDKAKFLPMPTFTNTETKVGGTATVEVKVNLQTGEVISAMAISGNNFLRINAVKAAMLAKFEPVLKEFPTIYGKGNFGLQI